MHNNNDNNNVSLNHAEDPSHKVNVQNMPTSLPDPQAVNSLMAKEMHSMSVNEREIVYEDIHGVAQINSEGPEFVAQSLFELKRAIHKIRSKPAYDLALSRSPDYAGGHELLLMFLRSTNFDIEKTATKIIQYFEHKRLYFGEDRLGRPIRFTDMDENDMNCLKTGWIQVLPFRDKAGRAVVWYAQNHQPNEKAINIIRAMWYFLLLVCQDEETQKSGVVLVAHRDGLPDMTNEATQFFWHGTRYATYAPYRVVSCHYCFDSPMIAPLVSLVQLAANKEIRARNRIHGGTQTEWMYSLMAFGIPVDHAPVTSSGNLKLKFYRKWSAEKYYLETTIRVRHGVANQQFGNRRIIDLPRRNDILLGKGKLQQYFTGNRLFQQVMQEQLEQFMNADSKEEKMVVAQQVWEVLQQEGSRFLDRHDDDCSWVPIIEEDVILNKIFNQLRTKKPIPSLQGKKKQNDISSGKRQSPSSSSSTTTTSSTSSSKDTSPSSSSPSPSNTSRIENISFINYTEKCEFNILLCSHPSAKRVKF